MKLTLATHGGLAALRRAPVVVDSAALPGPAAAELCELVRAAEREAAARPAPAAPRARRPDAQSHVVQIEEGGETRSLRGGDLDSDAAFDALHEWLLRHAAGAPPAQQP